METELYVKNYRIVYQEKAMGNKWVKGKNLVDEVQAKSIVKHLKSLGVGVMANPQYGVRVVSRS